MKIISFTNQKGGVGKTSLTIHLAGEMNRNDRKVLCIDLDPQGHLSDFFVPDIYAVPVTIRSVLIDEQPIQKAIQHTKFKNIDVISSNVQLSDLDSHLAGQDDAQYLLRDNLELLNKRYDYVLLDCPPFLGRATRMALVASTHFIIPIEAQQ